MRLSARNRWTGRVVEVVKGAAMTRVRIEAAGTMITAAITTEAAEELGLQVGDTVSALVKATDVMVAKD